LSIIKANKFFVNPDQIYIHIVQTTSNAVIANPALFAFCGVKQSRQTMKWSLVFKVFLKQDENLQAFSGLPRSNAWIAAPHKSKKRVARNNGVEASNKS
jgi:hypothetical protein